ncbi:MAG: YaiI/YqxD family protein [Synergistaceae bacterium]|nr:YaiI/YqxD family protein [Synergistaceae bacterium]
MRILVDADACPVKQIIVRLAKLRGIPVTMFIDTAHELDDGYSTIITVACQVDSVDYALVNYLAGGDIVVTQDFGLAAMALAKGASVVNQNGFVYTNENIDQLLFERSLGQKLRRAGGRTKGPAKRSKEDDERFTASLSRLAGIV